jgi:hypothetical protein
MAETIPLSVPDDLLKEARETAELTHLSVQDVFRQSAKLGMPKLREQLMVDQGSLAPLSEAELAAAYAQMSPDELKEDAQLGQASLKAQKGK